MNLDGARNAKSEIFRQAFGFRDEGAANERTGLSTFVPPVQEPLSRLARAGALLRELVPDGIAAAFSVGARDHGPELPVTGEDELARETKPPVAIGIGQTQDAPGKRIVLLGTRRKDRDHPVVHRAIEIARGEAEFVYTGANRLLSHWQPPRRRPICPGISVGHYTAAAGTLGGFVDLGEEGLGILSNNHVLANVNRGQVGDDILQPARSDTGAVPGDKIGELLRYVEIRPAAERVNFVDCAVAKLTDDLAPSAVLPDAGVAGQPRLVAGISAALLLPGMPVFKCGRTTGLTRGSVFIVEVDNYVVNLGSILRPMYCRFDDQFQITADEGEFARAGDSGSLVLDGDGRACGLLFAGSPTGAPSGAGLAAANPIDRVLQELDTALWVG